MPDAPTFRALDRPPGPADRWIGFDEEVLVLDEGAGRRADDLVLVGQLASSFERAHPDVPVVVRRGRYLVADLAGHPELRRSQDANCWATAPVPYGTTVVRRDRRAQGTPRPGVAALVCAVDAARLGADIAHLAALANRHSTQPGHATAASWAEARLASLGYTTATTTFPVGAGTSRNVVADRAGTAPEADRQVVVVCAHLDSVNLVGGPGAAAPGADDNASGAAGVLAVARLLATATHAHDLRVVLFGGEEQGLLGSKRLVAGLTAAERARIRAVVNLDMVAVRNTSAPSVLLEGAPVSQPVIDALAEAAATYTSLAVSTSLHPFASDHVPFLEAGIPAVLTIEGDDSANTAFHTAADTPDRLDLALAAEIVRMDTAAVAHLLEVPVPEITLPDIGEITVQPPFRRHRSGTYTLNGGASSREGGATRAAGPAAAELPLLDPPVGIGADVAALGGPVLVEPAFFRTRLTLRVDIDGDHPLDVVSGTVARGLFGTPAHFIGRVVAKNPTGLTPTGLTTTTSLVVEDFTFTWPGSSYVVDRATVEVAAPLFGNPVATVTFHASGPGRSFGPYVAPRTSPYFREVEIEVDIEDGAVACEPYDTHTHPDRPADLPKEALTLAKVLGRAGVRITTSPNGNVISSNVAGPDHLWDERELHDAMDDHWSRYSNVPQWKMWVFLAEKATQPTLGGIMFDGNIDEPGGVDRQGTAIFTKCEHFHGAGGAYPLANPPAAAAATRELFFDLVHETGHAFNLAHSFHKQSVSGPGDSAWPAPPWMPLLHSPQALSFMNYPDLASPGTGDSAKWFYDRFRFRFDDGEHLFLRHAPDHFVQMGNEAWFHNHGRVDPGTLDRRLELVLRTRTPVVEVGQPVMAELRLENVSNDPIIVDPNLDPLAEGVAVAVIGPDGRRRPFLPWVLMRAHATPCLLAPGQAIYAPVNLTMGKLGFAFTEPGTYTVQASYENVDGTTAVAAMGLVVRASADAGAAAALFDARVGRVLTVGGSRTMGDANDRIAWVQERLGDAHPTSTYLAAVLAKPYERDFKAVRGDESTVQVLERDPTEVERRLAPVVAVPERAADVLGHITFRAVTDAFTDAAEEVGHRRAAVEAQQAMLGIFREREVVTPVVEAVEKRVAELT